MLNIIQPTKRINTKHLFIFLLMSCILLLYCRIILFSSKNKKTLVDKIFDTNQRTEEVLSVIRPSLVSLIEPPTITVILGPDKKQEKQPFYNCQTFIFSWYALIAFFRILANHIVFYSCLLLLQKQRKTKRYSRTDNYKGN